MVEPTVQIQLMPPSAGKHTNLYKTRFPKKSAYWSKMSQRRIDFAQKQFLPQACLNTSARNPAGLIITKKVYSWSYVE